jgi:hypothetical protein
MKQLRRYIDAALATGFDSTVNAVTLFFGATGISVQTGGDKLEWRHLAGLLIASFVYGIAKYCSAHPLAAEVERIQAQSETITKTVLLLVIAFAAACAGCTAIHLGKLGGDW